MLVAGEASGDALAAELVRSLREQSLLRGETADRAASAWRFPQFHGAGGPRMRAAGVDLTEDLTTHSVLGPAEVVKRLAKFVRLFNRLHRLARQLQPEGIVLVDYGGFNRRFAAAIKRDVRSHHAAFHNWNPRIVYFVSPQVWASRPGRAYQLARDVDLMLSIFPFEKDWYAKRVPQFRVEFVGHPFVDRYPPLTQRPLVRRGVPLVLLLPGSRKQEVSQHLVVMHEATRCLKEKQAVRVRVVLPDDRLLSMAREMLPASADVEVRVGGLQESLEEASLAIASSGTVTLECALAGVPAVVVYRVPELMFRVARPLIKVPFIAMPNLLADELVFPELVQSEVTAERIMAESLDLLTNAGRRAWIHERLYNISRSLGGPGAAARAASEVLRLWS